MANPSGSTRHSRNSTLTPAVRACASASANCGCTKPEYPVKPVAPGKEGQIKVTYQPKGRPGSFSKNIYVYTNGEPERVVLLITGTVIPKP